ncbi:MAG: hypothetical protein P9L94_17130 [Candidatus Hinthialibacter antarcticus]|nr:hypothetical protein [Candidatus Hinthialibacter antarcticus]
MKISQFSKIGSFNAGAMGFFLPEKVVNLDGLANDDVYHFTEDGGSIGDYVRENAIDYCIDLNIEDVLQAEQIPYTTLRTFPLNDSDHFSIVQIHADKNFQAHNFKLRVDGALHHGVETIGLFENATEGWVFQGDAMDAQPSKMELGLFPKVTGYVGNGLIHSGLREDEGAHTGTTSSPIFSPKDNQRLIFAVGGSQNSSVGVRLMKGESILGEWRGKGEPQLDKIILDLSPYTGEDLRLYVFDHDENENEFILFDHAMILEPTVDIENL